MAGIDKTRSTARFISDDPIDGSFTVGPTSWPVVVRDLSVIGAQIEHEMPLRPAMQGRLTVATLSARSVVIWTRMSGPGVYRSGLRLEERLDVVAAEIRGMLAEGVVRKGEDTVREREAARRRREEDRAKLIGSATGNARTIGLPQETLYAIRAARHWFLAHPHDAMKWYLRAKMTATEEMLQMAGAGKLNREDVLAVWEYLERRYDLRDVVRALG